MFRGSGGRHASNWHRGKLSKCPPKLMRGTASPRDHCVWTTGCAAAMRRALKARNVSRLMGVQYLTNTSRGHVNPGSPRIRVCTSPCYSLAPTSLLCYFPPRLPHGYRLLARALVHSLRMSLRYEFPGVPYQVRKLAKLWVSAWVNDGLFYIVQEVMSPASDGSSLQTRLS